jgi:NAD(P)-dependent dehydrogenase (short-subunit alcohol dehydrogenase family)
MSEVSTRVAVVTGAAQGVGLAAVEGLREDGFVVVGVDLADAPPAQAEDAGVEWVAGSVADTGTWARVVELATRRDPAGASALVACAADHVVAEFLDTTPAQFTRLFEINVLGVLHGMQALIPAMVARGSGAIAVVGSVDSLYTEQGMAAYSASKAALLQVVRSAAVEHSRHGLRINAVCPGAIDTVFLRRALEVSPDPDGDLAAATARIPAGAILRPDEVASVLRFLVSDAASGMSGAAVAVDGGLTATYDYAPHA